MKKSIMFTVIFLFTFVASTIHAEELKPTKTANAQYLSISYTDFKPGKADRALEIIRNHYVKASQKAGTPVPYIVVLHSGEWDMVTVWTLKEGYASMEWEITEDGIKWMQAFNELEGEEKGKEIREEFNSLIHRSSHQIGYHPTDIK